jgi:hypothetical protein
MLPLLLRPLPTSEITVLLSSLLLSSLPARAETDIMVKWLVPCFVSGRSPVRILAQMSAIAGKAFHGFAQSFHRVMGY